jgi:hypothetical protein
VPLSNAAKTKNFAFFLTQTFSLPGLYFTIVVVGGIIVIVVVVGITASPYASPLSSFPSSVI